jgi:hypothetical protein
MADFIDQDLGGSRFEGVDLTHTHFDRVHLEHVEILTSEMYDLTIRGTDPIGVRMHGVEIVDLDIVGEVIKLTVNGVDVAPMVEAELDRRDGVRRYLDGLTEETLATSKLSVGGQPAPSTGSVRPEHRLHAERDLAALESRT